MNSKQTSLSTNGSSRTIGCWVPLAHHNTADNNLQFANFQKAVNNTCLNWIFTKRIMSVDFMDMTLTIVGDKIETTLYKNHCAPSLHSTTLFPPTRMCEESHQWRDTTHRSTLLQAGRDHWKDGNLLSLLRHCGYPPSFLLPQFKKALEKADKIHNNKHSNEGSTKTSTAWTVKAPSLLSCGLASIWSSSTQDSTTIRITCAAPTWSKTSQLTWTRQSGHTTYHWTQW